MLFVKKSTIPKAGKGLFTDTLIKKGEYIIEYTGDIITWDEVVKRSEAGRGGYAFYISKKKCIDAFDHPESLARYANDARGTGRVNGLRNNAVYAIKNGKGYIQATRNIKPGEEILVWYGPDYWDEHEEEMRAYKKRVRSEASKKAWQTRLKKKTKSSNKKRPAKQ
jgi:SET domain-containing protein